jgi:putative lipoic acid-binding regulatory protein
MSDPATIGVVVSSVLALAAEAVKSAVGEAAKDAYKALKERVSQWASGEVATLEAAPSSKGKQLAVAEIIDAQTQDDKDALRALAEIVITKLKEITPAIGADFNRVNDLEIQLGNIAVTSGIGIRVQDARGGTVKTGNIVVGDRSGK